MNRNVVRAFLVGITALAIVMPITPAEAKPIQTISTTVQAGGYWVTVTKYPSRYGSLASIANSVYGNRALWSKIYQANRSRIKNPNYIRVGQRIYVPKLSFTRSTGSISRTKSTAGWVKPLSHLPTTSCYGMRRGRLHAGIDYDGVTGQRIMAVGKGVVKKASWWAGGYGNSVLIYHSGNTYTHYAHMSRIAVRVGQRVYPGQTIGYVGATGIASGSHLHFEVWRGMWHQVNPAPWLRAHGIRTGC